MSTLSMLATIGVIILGSNLRQRIFVQFELGHLVRHLEIIVFSDRNHSEDPTQLSVVVGPALEDKADLVMGSRIKGRLERGATFFILHTEQLTYGWLVEMAVKTVKTW